MNIQAYLFLASILFSIGVYGLLTRRNAVGVLASIEIMANAVNINLIAFSRFHGHETGQVFALFSTAITVAEVVVGLALVIILYRSRRDVLADLVSELRG